MKNEDAHARRTCRIFVLIIFGVMIVAVLLALDLFHPQVIGKPHAAQSVPTPEKH
jgi:hypothetical protein